MAGDIYASLSTTYPRPLPSNPPPFVKILTDIFSPESNDLVLDAVMDAQTSMSHNEVNLVIECLSNFDWIWKVARELVRIRVHWGKDVWHNVSLPDDASTSDVVLLCLSHFSLNDAFYSNQWTSRWIVSLSSFTCKIVRLLAGWRWVRLDVERVQLCSMSKDENIFAFWWNLKYTRMHDRSIKSKLVWTIIWFSWSPYSCLHHHRPRP